MSSTIRNFINSGLPQQPKIPFNRTNLPDPSEIVQDIDPPQPRPQPIKFKVNGRGITSEELELIWFDKSMDQLKDRSIIFYGPSGSGKTVLIHDIMYEARNIFPKVLIFAPTNREKRDYEGIVPTELIYEEFDLEDIRTVYNSQMAGARVYNTANKIDVLEKLFNRVATPIQKQHIVKLENQKQRAEQEVRKIIKKMDVRKQRLDELENRHTENLSKFYKSVISQRQELLQQMHLSTDEVLAVKYLNYNPRILIIFDDAMTEILTLIKKLYCKALPLFPVYSTNG